MDLYDSAGLTDFGREASFKSSLAPLYCTDSFEVARERLRYFSAFSGIEAASAAWHKLGWNPAGFSEIDPFANSVLAHRFPNTRNYGDITKHGEWGDIGPVDILVGGSPCQSFSVAGLRGGFEDARGQLTLTYLRLAQQLNPEWIVWENVPGVLSADGGRAFGGFLGALVQLGYGFSYRVLDAQFFGVPQRRRRVFLVARRAGDWRSCAEVLFERASLRGNPAPRRETRKAVAGDVEGCVGAVCSKWSKGTGGPSGDECQNLVVPAAFTDSSFGQFRDGFGTLRAHGGTCGGGSETVLAFRKSRRAKSSSDHETWVNDGVANTMNGFDVGDVRTTQICFHPTQDPISSQGVSHALGTGSKGGCATVAVALGTDLYNGAITGDVSATIGTQGSSPTASGPTLMSGSAVRRLTPRECERLQGFPDDWTLVPHRGKPASDGPRYKAIGNSMAVPCMEWIGQRIQAEASWRL